MVAERTAPTTTPISDIKYFINHRYTVKVYEYTFKLIRFNEFYNENIQTIR